MDIDDLADPHDVQLVGLVGITDEQLAGLAEYEPSVPFLVEGPDGAGWTVAVEGADDQAPDPAADDEVDRDTRQVGYGPNAALLQRLATTLNVRPAPTGKVDAIAPDVHGVRPWTTCTTHSTRPWAEPARDLRRRVGPEVRRIIRCWKRVGDGSGLWATTLRRASAGRLRLGPARGTG